MEPSFAHYIGEKLKEINPQGGSAIRAARLCDAVDWAPACAWDGLANLDKR